MIRAITKDDYEDFKKALLECFTSQEDHAKIDYELMDWFIYEKIFKNPPVYCLIDAEPFRGFIVGRADGNRMQLYNLYILKEYRRLGIGYALKEALTKLAKDLGFEEIYALNRYNNTPSLNLNLKAGWKQEVVYYKTWKKLTQ